LNKAFSGNGGSGAFGQVLNPHNHVHPGGSSGAAPA